MDIKKQAVNEYLTLGFTYRQLAAKYGVSRSDINTWVLVHQGVNDLPCSKRQHSYDHQQMKQGKYTTQNNTEILTFRLSFFTKSCDKFSFLKP